MKKDGSRIALSELPELPELPEQEAQPSSASSGRRRSETSEGILQVARSCRTDESRDLSSAVPENERRPELDGKRSPKWFAPTVFDAEVLHVRVLGNHVVDERSRRATDRAPTRAEFHHEGTLHRIELTAGELGVHAFQPTPRTQDVSNARADDVLHVRGRVRRLPLR